MKSAKIALALLSFWSCTGQRPDTMEIGSPSLAPCPATPNCVSTMMPSSDEKHFVAPLAFPEGVKSPSAMRQKLEDLLNSTPGVHIAKATDSYIYAEFTSNMMRYVDDVQFIVDGVGRQVHVRSASRLGRSDFGVNRKRVESIRQRLNSTSEKQLEK